MRRVMKILVRTALVLVVVLPLAALVAAILAFDDGPSTSIGAELTPDDAERARMLLRMHDPRGTPDGQLRTVTLTGSDIDVMVNFAASRYKAAANVVLQDREAVISASVRTPESPFGEYLNITAVVGETSALPRFESLTVGSLPIPGWISNRALAYALKRLSKSDLVASDVISSVSIGEGLLRVEYEWQNDLPERLKALAVSTEENERLRAYHDRIARVVEDLPPQRVLLPDLVRPVMQLAEERSAAGDTAEEHRAAIVTLAFYVIGRGPSVLVPEARDWPRAQPRRVLLRGRDDLPKHFAISAALAATAGTPLSDVVGLYKEIDDSRGGTGFSFSDIAADRAGTAFGQMAIQSRESARRLDARIADGLTEADMLPEIGDLPDHMPEEEFKRRFGGVGAPAYSRLVEDIESRVAECRLFQ